MFRAGADAFERELDMTRRIEALRAEQRAPHLVQSLGTGEAEGRGWIAFEYLDGGSLEDLISAKGPLAPGWAARYTCDAGRALVRLHAAGIFHRDVKPANLLLASDAKVRLGDFGLSRDLAGKLSAAGSPAFAAPEMIAGNVSDGQRADVYSLGATLFFLLTAETCHPGHPDVFALEACGVPGPLQLVLVAAMARTPEKRTATVEEVLVGLEELELPLEEERHVAAPEGPWRQTGPGVAPAPARAPSGTPQEVGSSWWSSARARRRGALGFVALGVVTLGTGAAAWLAGDRSAAIEFRLEAPLPGVEVRLGERDLGPLAQPLTLRLAPGKHVLQTRREGVISQSQVVVEAGQPQTVSVRVHHPLRVEGGEGVVATVRDARGELVRARAGWVLKGHPLPFEARLPLGRYQVALDGPDHHPRSWELDLSEGGQRVEADLRPVRRFGVRVAGVDGFWSRPLIADLNGDGVRDLILNGFDARDGVLIALSGRDGEALWRLPEQTNRWASAALAPGGEVAIGVLAPHEDPTFGVAQALLLDPKTGEPRRRVNLGLSSRPPMTPTPFELAGERGLFLVTDRQLAPPWAGARLSAVRADGEVLWQRRGPAGDGQAADRHGLFARGIDRDADGADESVLWELEGRLLAFAPGAEGEVHWRSEVAPSSLRSLRWSPDYEVGPAFAAWPEGGPVGLVALDVQGQVLWRRRLRGQFVARVDWHQLDGRGPRELVVSALQGAWTELSVFDAQGEPLAARRLPSERAYQVGVLRGEAGRYLVVEAHVPARIWVLDTASLETVWSRDLRVADATLAIADLDGDGLDALVVSYRDGRVEVLDPDLPK